MNDLIKAMKEHNDKVRKEFKRAKKGEIICLTDLMISRERIVEKINALPKAHEHSQGGD